ncbi:hypothetical protein C8R45DRAFT_937960 [Mycena sanguinolenta]|nr:hypothetical protein C8R45DRAFT_937960 [Mycena sanguinolenta]
MTNTGTLAAAREYKSQCLTESKAKAIAVATKSSSPPLTALSLFDSEQSLYFPDSPMPMVTLSDDDLPSLISLPTTGSKQKSESGFLSDDASDFTAKPAKKEYGHQLKAQSDSENDEVVQKPPKKKPGPKSKPKAMPKAKPARTIVLMVVLIVSEAISESSQCLSIKTTMLFEDALELIQETIGCYMTKKKGKMTIMDLNDNDSAGEDDDDESIADGEKAIAELNACLYSDHLSLNPGLQNKQCYENNATTSGSLPGYHPHPLAAPQLPSSSAIHPHLLSDPPEEDVSYPSITNFIMMLIRTVPQFEKLRTERFGFVVPGDATYLLDKVQREVKRLDKVASDYPFAKKIHVVPIYNHQFTTSNML